jgi:hypothetical protein
MRDAVAVSNAETPKAMQILRYLEAAVSLPVLSLDKDALIRLLASCENVISRVGK